MISTVPGSRNRSSEQRRNIHSNYRIGFPFGTYLAFLIGASISSRTTAFLVPNPGGRNVIHLESSLSKLFPLSTSRVDQFLGQLPTGESIHRARTTTVCDMSAFDVDTKLIDGKATAAAIRGELTSAVERMRENTGKSPGLAVVLVGERRDSATYVRMKKKACDEIGVQSFGFDFPEDVTQEELLKCVGELNARDDIHGILVQLPLPAHIDEQVVLCSIMPSKDVDGLHPENIAALCLGRTRSGAQGKTMFWDLSKMPFHVACTPQGCIELLERSGVVISGKRAVVLGRSNIVGVPVTMLLRHKDATVTTVHSKTEDPASVVREADIVIAAVGRAGMVKADWVKPGAVVIDVGINSVDDSTVKKGYRLVGDVDFEGVKEVASKITPVPGGVGPMTIAMLLRNTVNGAIRAQGLGSGAAGGAETAPLKVPI